MNIAHLSLRSIVFELRYPNAFHLWDRSGKIWTDALHIWPELALREAAPNQTRFTLGTRAEIAVNLDRSFTSVAGSGVKIEEFLPYCQFLPENALQIMEVNTLTRVGLKATFVKQYEKMEDMVTDFFATGITKKIDNKFFGIEGKVVDSSGVTIRVEGTHLGCTATLLMRSRTMKLDVPMIGGDDDFKPVTKEHLELAYDCDYFTTTQMELGQLKANHWINQAMHVIRRDSALILGG